MNITIRENNSHIKVGKNTYQIDEMDMYFFVKFDGPIIMCGGDYDVNMVELQGQVELLAHLDGGLAQPDHSESEQAAKRAAHDREILNQFRAHLVESIKTALLLDVNTLCLSKPMAQALLVGAKIKDDDGSVWEVIETNTEFAEVMKAAVKDELENPDPSVVAEFSTGRIAWSELKPENIVTRTA